jgi:hypothetical protein
MKTTNHLRALSISASFGLFLATLATFAMPAMLAACETEDPSKAVVDNGYPATAEGADPAHQTVVYRAWWVATYFGEPVGGGSTSTEQRSVPASDVAYAVLAPDWDPASATPPARFVFVRSKAPLSVARGDTLHIVVDDGTFTGNCAAGQPLSQDDADFITQRIFPGEIGTATYDAKTCTMTPAAAEASDAGQDGADGADGD